MSRKSNIELSNSVIIRSKRTDLTGLRIEVVIMSDYEINEGECYCHILTRVVVRVIKVRWHEGFTGLVYWEALKGHKIDGEVSGIQEAQHFLADFYLVRVSAAIAAEERA